MDSDCDNYILRESCLLKCDLDILGIAETHLLHDNVLQVEGYKWFGLNRTIIHKRAKLGSGGIGFLVKNQLFNVFDISIVQNSFEGILWLKLVHKITKDAIFPCVCYLPPENSSRYFDVHAFYDILADIYRFQNEGVVYVCGDFNSRCGDLEDFICGVDSLPPRDVIDFVKNSYGELFIDFLINTNMCMLNGRNCIKNDFTSISVKGTAVVDYCVTSHENLKLFKDFCIVRVSDLINSIDYVNTTMPASIPDHSLLMWNTNYETNVNISKSNTISIDASSSFDKFELRNIPNDFLNSHDTTEQINTVIEKLESGINTQTDIDNIYLDWCNIVKDNMYSKLSYKTVNISSSHRKRRAGKPWWSDKLSDLWNIMCHNERKWLDCKNRSDKLHLKSVYISSRKIFDHEVQRCKRIYWYSMQNDLLNDCKVDSNQFWKSIGKIGIGYSKNKQIPMEVRLDNGDISSTVTDVLQKWKTDYSSLFKEYDAPPLLDFLQDPDSSDNVSFNERISIFEVKKAISSAKIGKACGADNIPTEVLKNDTTVYFLHVLFNVIFDSGVVPGIWGKCIINPIPKSSSADPRDPLSYRGISLAPAVYKLYCSVLNDRLSTWAEENEKLVDEQNGFRKKRTTIDQISSLSNLIDTRKKLKQSTFCAFIDFRKAYDNINRNKLWKKLHDSGISGKMLTAVRSLYSNVSSCVRVNSYKTDWFSVHSGLRQGCTLSPLLFNLYINDLAVYLKSLNIGVSIESEIISILLYADDIVLLAENKHDLQVLLNALSEWCNVNDMQINCTKSNIVHFRPPSVQKVDFVFKCGNETLDIVDRYTYLGIVLTEHLDFNVTARTIAQSASRALGLVIAKCKLIGGVPFNVFTKLYDSLVWPVISYGAAVWGCRSFSCINAVQNRAMRYFLGVGKYTPNAALAGEMAWQPPVVRQWKTIASYWACICNTRSTRINKRIAVWASVKAGTSCKNWFFSVKKQINDCNLVNCSDVNVNVSKAYIVEGIQSYMTNKFIAEWLETINRTTSVTGRGGNKLRNYCTYKSEFTTEHYCNMIMPPQHRSAYCKFRCGVAPIRIETGRFENLNIENRTCPFCQAIETESHVIFDCPLYNDLRISLLNTILSIEPNFYDMQDIDKLKLVFSNHSLIRICAKTCNDILNRRQFYLCK